MKVGEIWREKLSHENKVKIVDIEIIDIYDTGKAHEYVWFDHFIEGYGYDGLGYMKRNEFVVKYEKRWEEKCKK